MSVSTMVTELCEFNDRRTWIKWENYYFGQKWYFKEIFGMQLSFDMCSAVKL